MSRDIEIRFRGIVKSEFRKEFSSIALEGKWSNSSDVKLSDFGMEHPHYSPGIPMADSAGCYFVDRWNTEPWNRSWNKETGEWQFQISMNWNRASDCLCDFIDDIIPYLMESVDHFETWIEPVLDDPYEPITTLKQFQNGKFEFCGLILEDGTIIDR